MTSPHYLVSQAALMLEQGRPDELGIIKPPAGAKCLSIRVSKENVERALRIANALVQALDNRGFAIRIADSRNSTVTVLNTTFEFSVFEGVMPAGDAKQFTASRPVSKGYVRTGRLGLNLDKEPFIYKEFCDGPRRRVEIRLNEFIAEMFRQALRIVAITKEQLRQKMEKELQERQLQWEIDEENRKRQLHESANAWCESQRIRAYIAAFRERAIKKRGMFSEDENQWLAWAETYANSIDPLSCANESTADGERHT